MMILGVAKAAAAALAGSLAFSTGRNMVQTYRLTHSAEQLLVQEKLRILPITLSELQNLQRKELLQMYVNQCHVPADLSAIEGDWNGFLLKNNGLTSVTRFITNKLFGKGRQWNGKSFDTSNRTGMNRFEIFAQEGDPYVEEKVTVILKTELDHSFDLELADSRLHPGQPSIVVTYKPYQGPLSLWKSMVDELRILPCNSATHDILIGMGSMGWSGGVLNCSPFCLYRRKQKR